MTWISAKQVAKNERTMEKQHQGSFYTLGPIPLGLNSSGLPGLCGCFWRGCQSGNVECFERFRAFSKWRSHRWPWTCLLQVPSTAQHRRQAVVASISMLTMLLAGVNLAIRLGLSFEAPKTAESFNKQEPYLQDITVGCYCLVRKTGRSSTWDSMSDGETGRQHASQRQSAR